jgi:hypothetical protein
MIKLIDLIKESHNLNVYQVEIKLVLNTEGDRSVTDILSDIRAIKGITIVEIVKTTGEKTVISTRHVLNVRAKIDPAPFKPWDNSRYDEILKEIKKVDSVLAAEYKTTPQKITEVRKKKKLQGLWANIRAKRERGEAPAKKGSKAYKKAVKAAKEINKNK